MANVYNIPHNYPFLETLASGVLKEYDNSPLELSKIVIFLPNKRACRSLYEAFLRISEGRPLMLPRIFALGDIDNDWLTLKRLGGVDIDVPNIMSLTHQHIMLTKLVVKWQSLLNTPDHITVSQAAHLAIALMELMAEVTKERLSLKDMENIVPEELSRHWQITLDFIRILVEEWPKILQASNYSDIHTHRNVVLKAQVELWEEIPPEYPVIVAGSTGSIPATAELLRTVANLPMGTVILPGLDVGMDQDSWEALGETHAQYGLKKLLAILDIQHKNVKIWKYAVASPNIDRTQLVAEIMRPSHTVDKWREIQNISSGSIEGIELVVAPTIQDEASVIALMIKEAIQVPHKTVALVTNQRDLAKRVSSILCKWDIVIDDSAGSSLSLVPQAVFLRVLIRMVADKMNNVVSLLQCLKHPISACGIDSKEFSVLVAKLETDVLRGRVINNGLHSIYEYSKSLSRTDLEEFCNRIDAIIKPLLNLISKDQLPFSEILLAHVKVAEGFAASGSMSGSERLWHSDSGHQLKQFIDNLMVSAESLGDISPAEYPDLLDALFMGQVFRPKYGTHPRLAILSPMEARMLSFDLVIIGELNEGSWPQSSKADPWMSRPMRNDFGLPLPEKKIGQSAHDFSQLFCAPEVVMTRCTKLGGTQTIPSRWLLRLDAILRILDFQKNIKPTKPWLRWAELLNEPDDVVPCLPPCPTPSKDVRPKTFSVTAIEKLMRDPYAVYAQKILGLYALDPLDDEPGAAEFGNFIHNSIEQFVNDYDNIAPNKRYETFLQLGDAELKHKRYDASIITLWWPKFERIALWFVENEVARRTINEQIIGEQKGKIFLNAGDDVFCIEARADRLERDALGNITIIDYKTGTVPALSEVKLGLSPQMTLEGLIANEQGFQLTGKTVGLEYWKLSGGEVPAERLIITDAADVIIEQTRGGVKKLLGVFARSDTPYLACPDPDTAPRYSDYTHLERVKEWS